MRAVIYGGAGDSSTLEVVQREPGTPGPGEVRVRLAVSGVNPTDWKRRAESGARSGDPDFAEVVPGQDGAGVIDAVGPGVSEPAVGTRVWTILAQAGRPTGTAQEYTVLPVDRVVPLPDAASYELGASLGVPAVTAHHALTLGENGPRRLSPGALAGQTVLIAGGAGAVSHFAIQLARWAGARVITTVSGTEKARLALAAGADHVINYRESDAAAQILALAPDGLDLIVEVALAQNAALDLAVAANHATVVSYANNGGDAVALPIRPQMAKNLGYRFFVLYTVGAAALGAAAEDITAALADGALSVGAGSGLPILRFALEETGQAHDAVEAGAVGKVLIDIAQLR